MQRLDLETFGILENCSLSRGEGGGGGGVYEAYERRSQLEVGLKLSGKVQDCQPLVMF